jgi:hypothetical protein
MKFYANGVFKLLRVIESGLGTQNLNSGIYGR